MKSWSLAAAAALATGMPAGAAVITLEDVSAVGADYRFTYQGTLGPDEGVIDGSRLVIFDFLGLIDGSIFSPSADLVGSSELTTATPFITPGYSDDPSVPNLIFTYVGSDFQNSGGPFAPFDFDGFGALSSYGDDALGAYTTFTVANNPPGAENTGLTQLGVTGIPSAVPEPATWAMMIAGFTLVGGAMRRRRIRRVLI